MFHSIAGFFLSHAISPRNMTYRQNGGTFDGICKYRQTTYRQKGAAWHLQTPSPRTQNTAENPLATSTRMATACICWSIRWGKYWRMNYRFADKRKTLALGVYPEVLTGEGQTAARQGPRAAGGRYRPRHCQTRRKAAKAAAAGNTFEAVAEQWLKATAAKRAAITQDKVTTWLRKGRVPLHRQNAYHQHWAA
jgi:hypothetical protein